MANLAKLAIKLVADMEQAQKDFSTMSKTISIIDKSAKNATPSMQNLTDTVKGLGMMQEVAKHINDPLAETRRVAGEAAAALGTIKSTVKTMGQGVAEDILHMKPTIANVMQAQGEIKKLIALQKELGKDGHLLNDAIHDAQKNLATLGNNAVQVTADMQMFKSVINGLNMVPFNLHDVA